MMSSFSMPRLVRAQDISHHEKKGKKKDVAQTVQGLAARRALPSPVCSWISKERQAR